LGSSPSFRTNKVRDLTILSGAALSNEGLYAKGEDENPQGGVGALPRRQIRAVRQPEGLTSRSEHGMSPSFRTNKVHVLTIL
jgi:hypothetical protein